MKARAFAALIILGAALLLAQSPSSAPATQTHSSEIGFTYSLPADWEVVDAGQSLPAVKQKVENEAASEDEKKGAACIQVALTARHGTPASVVVVVALPFDCFGQQMTGKDLPGFASGASEGLKSTFDITEPLNGSYSLGTHTVWIERTKGTLKGHPEVQYKVETVCSILKKGAVCWMAMLADNAALQTFEHGAVTLDGEAPAALVPADALVKSPPEVIGK
ncbi:MAG TPA: hypothetical protein VGE83_05605 [Terracidiphilus sp.]|jgi:hypothetical protein